MIKDDGFIAQEAGWGHQCVMISSSLTVAVWLNLDLKSKSRFKC